MRCVEVELPGGVGLETGWRRDATLKPLSGYDETFLVEETHRTSMAARATALLSRCVTHLGPLTTVTSDHIRSLSVGDREALLLHLRRLTFGEIMPCALRCPAPGCAEEMELELKIAELLVPPYPFASNEHEVVLESEQGRYRVRFRLPNGADQEAAVMLAADGSDAAAALILQRCVYEVKTDGSHETVSSMPAIVGEALPKKMAELDSQAEIVLELTCSQCGHELLALLDAATYFCGEIASQPQDLYREVHLLAFNYKWSEAEILSLSRQKRQLYVNLIADSREKV